MLAQVLVMAIPIHIPTLETGGEILLGIEVLVLTVSRELLLEVELQNNTKKYILEQKYSNYSREGIPK